MMYDYDEAMMVIREWDRYDEEERYEALFSLLEMFGKELGYESSKMFR